MTTVLELIRRHLTDNGFSGLHHDDLCGCDMEDLMSCSEPQDGCSPGYRGVSEDGDDYCIYPTRQAAADAEKGIEDGDED